MGSIETSDTYCAAFLLGRGATFLSRREGEGGRLRFSLELDGMADAMHDFSSGRGPTPIRALVWALKGLKSEVHGDLCPDILRPKTPDLYFAAFLRAAGVELSGVEGGGGKTYFVFQPTEPPAVLDDLRAQYVEGTAQTDARTFSGHIRDLRSRIHGGPR